ncbi:CAP domain-containing protein [Tepidamorphus sp. 3E244]|uniref:CAP domain-containing protein n=1 Tax=Tepidamorphus sp. 3E244 TaxID=3385498 RepID=UPI0038FC1FE5
MTLPVANATQRTRVRALAACLLACTLAAGLAACSGSTSNQPAFYQNLASSSGNLNEANARDFINNYRRTQGVGEVQLNPALTSLARSYAASLAANATASRPNPDGRLKGRLQSAGYEAADVEESVTAGYHTFAEAFSGWRDSPPHRKTMLMKNARDMGIAAHYAPNSKYRVYWVLVMAQPK